MHYTSAHMSHHPMGVEASRAAGLGARILVVDDNPAALHATSRVLRAAGYEVLEAATGAAGLAAASHVDLLVLDINLPDLDGFDLCNRLRADPRTSDLPVLHLSATFVRNDDRLAGLAAGMDGYLTRPVESTVLVATVRTLLFARRADQLRRRVEARLRTMFAISPTAIALVDAEFRYESVNPSYCALTGHTPQELLTASLAGGGLPPPDDLLPRVRIALETDGQHQGQCAVRRRQGDIVEVQWRLVSEPEQGVRVLIASDITQELATRRECDRLLASERAARAEAERSMRLKDEFLATLSHELRSPLNAILGWSMVLSATPELPATLAKGVAAIDRNARLQARMIDELLDYAGIAFGKTRVELTPLDPLPVLRAACEMMQDSAAAADVRLRLSLGTERLRARIDAGRLQQIVVNLLSNAIKFSPAGGTVSLEATRLGERLRIAVSDRGKGISPEFLPHVFERFAQQDGSLSRAHGGLGLGLAIVKHLVMMHAGVIEAYSAGEGQGATFTVELPLCEDETVIPGAATAPASDLHGVTVLVVEDDQDARELAARVLSDAGAAVLEADSAARAWEMVQQRRVGVVVSDIGMPGQDGYQFMRRLRANGFAPHTLPALALTGFARPEDRDEAFAVGFQDHLVKPFHPHALVARVARLCGRESRGTA